MFFSLKTRILVIIFICMVGFNAQGAKEESATKPQAPNSPKFVSGNWGVSCKFESESNPLSCKLSYAINMVDTKHPLLTVNVRRKGNRDKSHIMTLQLPHGIKLTEDVSLQIDDGISKILPILTSNVDGVYSSIDLSKELLASLKTGTKIKLSFFDINSREITFKINLKGFSAGFAKLD